MHCKSLWIKASAKYINVNVDLEKTEGEGAERLVGRPPGHSLQHTSFRAFVQGGWALRRHAAAQAPETPASDMVSTNPSPSPLYVLCSSGESTPLRVCWSGLHKLTPALSHLNMIEPGI